jgi:hypothetical protein
VICRVAITRGRGIGDDHHATAVPPAISTVAARPIHVQRLEPRATSVASVSDGLTTPVAAVTSVSAPLSLSSFSAFRSFRRSFPVW